MGPVKREDVEHEIAERGWWDGFIIVEQLRSLLDERDALARRVTEASNAIHAWCHDEDKRDAIEFIVSVLNILDPPVVAGRGGERG